jgi:bifunctional non-homologous end joining protein LigD
MALQEYRKKRSFKETPEPTGGKASGNQLHFVIQKHAASRLHYDFRLELKGVLKSWAVPKGPSLNPADKRLAMLVEDHPYDYKDFEGIIPEGNYGAGTVIVWDEGTYEPLQQATTKAEQEKILTAGFHAGQLKIVMHGQKLKGEFVLVKTPKRADNAWLLIKHRDAFASETDITQQDKSVVCGKTIEEVASDRTSKTWGSNRAAKKVTTKRAAVKTARAKRSPQKNSKSKSENKGNEGGAIIMSLVAKLKDHKEAMPKDVMPMLATLENKPVNQSGWLYEVKWDGYRAISYLNNSEVDIRSRNNKPFNEKFYPVFNALKDWKVNAVVDGEIIVLNDKGMPDFGALQTWRSEADGELVYYVFDILWFDGFNLMSVALSDRKEILREIVPGEGIIRLSENFDINASDFFALAEKMGLEGIVAKKADSLYTPDVRSKEWLKIKTEKHQEAVIGGYTRNENSSRKISALLLGVYEGDEFVFIGPVGTGFTTQMQEDILNKLRPLETATCPFNEVPEYNKPSRFRPDPPHADVTWVKPKLVAEISYRTIASDGSLRHPSFRGLRDDKKPKDIKRSEPLPEPVLEKKETTLVKSKGLGKQGLKERKTFLNPTDETQVRNISGHDLKFTNLSKIFWPEENVSKRDMLNYYYQVAPYMLPHVKNRPQTLNRFPNGIFGKSFYQKDVTDKVPDWIATHAYYSEADQRQKNFMVCTDEASLLYIASLGCIEINPWSSTTDNPDNPDWCIIDLDPDKNHFDQVIEAARVTHEVLDALGIPGYCKTSGSTGLHIYIPLGGKYTYEESKEFGRVIVKIVHSQLPGFTSIERLTANRKGKIYLDFLQNRPQATVAGVYSLRPKPGAPVSMPLQWDEVKKGLKMTDFNIHNAISRLKERGDIFKGVLEKGIDRQKTMRKIQEIFKIKELAI